MPALNIYRKEAAEKLTALLAEGNPVAVQIEVSESGSTHRIRLFVATNGVIQNITNIVANAADMPLRLPKNGATRYIPIERRQLEQRTDALRVYVERLLSPFAPDNIARCNIV